MKNDFLFETSIKDALLIESDVQPQEFANQRVSIHKWETKKDSKNLDYLRSFASNLEAKQENSPKFAFKR